jgi:2-methylcitrate dehydratase PrpD
VSTSVFEFSKNLSWDDVPAEVQHQAKRCFLDLIGVAAAGSTTEMSRIARQHAAHQFGSGTSGPGARMFFDNRRVSAAGAAMANAFTIDSFDAHDGHPLTKGHAGCGVLAGLLAIIDENELKLSGQEFLTSIVIGYEVAIRAGIALHATVPDYHTSGAWVGLGIAAVGARLLELDETTFMEAAGIAEYHGPRSQMMRVIDAPTMVKDGSGWGAMGGVSAIYMARDGFTGAPAISMEGEDAKHFYADLGTRWRSLEQYFKKYPVCRWAQPPVEAVFQLKADTPFDAEDITAIRIHTFHEAWRLCTRAPKTTEAAQYSLPFSVGTALVHGNIGAKEIGRAALSDPAVLKFSHMIELVEDREYCARFPAERWARVELTLRNGSKLISKPAVALGSAENPLSDAVLNEKFLNVAQEILPVSRAERIRKQVWRMDEEDNVGALLDGLFQP